MQNLATKKVIASVIKKDGKFLIAQRGKKDALYGLWEFPGGKMEEGESEKECLKRELFEEFGIEVVVDNYLCSSFFEHKGNLTEMRAYSISEFKGEFNLFEHQQIKWVSAEELRSFAMPEPDAPIVEYLLLNKYRTSAYA